VATVAHVKSLMDMSNQWSLSVAWFKKKSFFFRKNHETFLIGIGIVVNGDSHTKYKNVIAASVKVKYRYKMFVKFCLSVYFLQC
jgi:hypothetical protein